ncbi:DUF7019 family protein [Catenuloplanes indicus]|uniref:Uncharacterized protein n=1 Tax=Catenuloplanes indicus TaxID=137267 RepID=A0AAE3W9V1_9ACTN|nr:SAVMC3_10250 family protein [Catenuloplanes indicus]MDQ0371125.1 hypothetical protein [Catenuloplanes indicus]
MSLRYYLYISDSKVDILLPQIDPAFGRTRETEIGFNLRVAAGKRKVEATSDRIARLDRVVRYLDDFADVGTVDEPGQYFRGRMRMRWGPVGGELVWFAGATSRTVVGLGGSRAHVAGEGEPSGSSTLPGMVEGLRSVLAEEGGAEALATVHLAARQLRGTEQELEFVAKRLGQGPSPYPELDPRAGMTVLVGSPIFVALAD